ncbi:MAG: hypothetical protein R3A52_24260 [Polyangiales bacterium]
MPAAVDPAPTPTPPEVVAAPARPPAPRPRAPRRDLSAERALHPDDLAEHRARHRAQPLPPTMKLPPRRVAALGLLASCSVFDPSLYQQSSGGLTLADRCESAAALTTVAPNATMPVPIDTTTLSDNYREFAGCIGTDLPGNEGFFQVEMRRGETWHFHVDLLSPDADPALYVLPICTTIQCSPNGAADNCGPGRSEHFSFRPEADGAHVVGIDSRVAGGARYTVTVVRPVCGDGLLEHGEACDDMRPQSGVTCDRCHKVLSRPLESEAGVANDDFTNAMLLRPAAGFTDFAVTGTLGGCDLDMFRFEVAAGQAITAAVTSRAGGQCPAGVTMEPSAPTRPRRPTRSRRCPWW